jgi:Protein of unknown function (DUF3072)
MEQGPADEASAPPAPHRELDDAAEAAPEARPPAAARDDATQRGLEKDPDEWVTGDEPPTGAQLSYLETLAREAGQTLPEGLTKAQASKLIDELQEQTGRGR